MSENELRSAVSTLVKYLTYDPGYRETWKANIAMAFKDEYSRKYRNCSPLEPHEIHHIANDAAEYFLGNLCTERAVEIGIEEPAPTNPTADVKE